MAYTIKVNAVKHSVDVDGNTPLLWVLRDVPGMTGTKLGCGRAPSGACTVLIDDIATRSCITAIDSLGTAAITTIEAIGNTPNGKAFVKELSAHLIDVPSRLRCGAPAVRSRQWSMCEPPRCERTRRHGLSDRHQRQTF